MSEPREHVLLDSRPRRLCVDLWSGVRVHPLTILLSMWTSLLTFEWRSRSYVCMCINVRHLCECRPLQARCVVAMSIFSENFCSLNVRFRSRHDRLCTTHICIVGNCSDQRTQFIVYICPITKMFPVSQLSKVFNSNLRLTLNRKVRC